MTFHPTPPSPTIIIMWRKEGHLERIHDALRRQFRREADKKPEPSVAIIDSQSVKTTEKWGVTIISGYTFSYGNYL